MSSGYATMTPRLMPTGPTRSKRYVEWRTSQVPARKYNRKANRVSLPRSEATAVVIMDRVVTAETTPTLHNCNTCGRSAWTTHAEWRILHNH